MFDLENAFDSIAFKLEFVGISTLIRFSQSENAYLHIFVTFGGIKMDSIFDFENAYNEMILIFDGIENSLILRSTNKRVSNSLLFGSLLLIKYLSSSNLNKSLDGEIIFFFQFICSKTPSFFQFSQTIWEINFFDFCP